MNGFKLIFIFTCLLFIENPICGENYYYRRCSLTQMLIQHPMYPFGEEIASTFKEIPWNDRFNNHDLGVKVVKFSTQEFTDQTAEINKFLIKSNVANRSVAKWFCYDKDSGQFDISLLRERGIYNATVLDKQLANLSLRGSSILSDAGESLIPKTFLIMHDICFKGNYGNKKVELEKIGHSNSFKVKIISYIYKLEWPAEAIDNFYNKYYSGCKNFISIGDYNYRYIVRVESEVREVAKDLTQYDLIKLVVGRALDLNIAKLMKQYDEFRIMAPLISISPLSSYIGLKEGINEESKFEVLEIQINEDGIQRYVKRGTLRVKPGTIMDNRFSLDSNIKLPPTEFILESGGGFYPGMLIREID